MVKRTETLLRRIVRRMAVATLVAIVCAYCWRWADFLATSGPGDNVVLRSVHDLTEAVVRKDAPTVIDGLSLMDEATGESIVSLGGEPGESGRVFTETWRVSVGGRTLLARVSHRGHDYGELIEVVLSDLFRDGGWVIGPFLGLFLLVSILTVRGTLKPLQRLSRLAENIGPSTTDVRLPADDVPREVLPLVLAVNSALDRLDDGFRLQREFTADAAHELRTPLAVLSAHIDTLRDREVAGALRHDMDVMVRLVEQLLRIARVEALVVRPAETTNLGDLARNVAVWLGPMAIQTRRGIAVDVANENIVVHGQEEALFHAIRNLVDNALRHTAEGTDVVVTVLPDPPTVLVRDHGPGIPPEMRPMLFQRFWRGERHGVGTGLGLAIVKATMQAHGGSVEVEDAQGGGAQFRMTFPRHGA